MFESVLIANRGEIAVRISRTLHALGARSATVFAPDDERAAHVDACDLALEVPSYLDGQAIVAAAERAGAAAIHPGYGFLSENPAFAAAVVDSGLSWVGPPPAAIETMGDKARAKGIAREAGVPVVPGLDGDDVSLDELRGFCAEAGFPVVIKAVAGGGGKGMRVVRDASELEGALDSARREAATAFRDDRVLVESYLDRPRHIEVQVLADAHGTVLHLGERECSLQRRHQKVIEEAPSPVVDAALRERMGQAAVSLARACGYEGAGTVEFIAPADGSGFFFLEMNTRLQVEHPVTELVYGVDLVELQLRVAAGEPLALRQEDLLPAGHAVEARLYAEDPAGGFLPATGTIHGYREPAGVRVDSGVRAGDEVGTGYDPMLAKLIAHAPDRATALRKLERALGEMEVLGVTTNAAFSRDLLRREDVRAGDLDTGLLERVLHDLVPELPADLLPAAAVAHFLGDTAGTTVSPGPWRRTLDGHGDVRVRGDQVEAAGRTWTWRAGPSGENGALRIVLDGESRHYAVAREGDAVWVARGGHHLEARPERKARSGAAALPGSLEAPMPGTVLLVNVENGDAVQEGDVLIVLESMKMELSVVAPVDGTVEGLELSPGDKVALRQPLVAVTQ
ncbi:MAG: acetyl-CoA/propionyl-CoA carboxylase, biotin carboxylase, biotin carboxyl carrier protein [Thermoleophilaceae bacterium]|nr:acetyl-CoA/propionyl-CoA carboxylase, biotin carboxylase, biotin carboxyl carrier protein [Thermoleophilaceae bacterium]